MQINGVEWMISTVLCIAAILVMSFAFHDCLKIRIAAAPITVCATISCILVAFGAVLWPVAWIIWIGSGICLGYCITKKSSFLKFLSSPAILSFLLAACVVAIMCVGHDYFYSQCDEYSHWGPFFKWMFENHRIHIYYKSNLYHPSYPQGVQVFYYFMSRFSAGFRESETFAAMGILTAAATVSLLDGANWENKVVSVFSIAAVPFFLALYPVTWPFFTVYQDAILGAVFGAALAVILCAEIGENRSCFAVAPVCAFLSQIKATGWMFALIALAFWVLRLLLEDKRSFGKRACAFGIPAGAVLLYAAGWNLLVFLTGTSQKEAFSGPQREGFVQQIKGLILGTNAFAHSVLERYQVNFFQMPVVYNNYGTAAAMTILLFGVGLAGGVLLWRRGSCRGGVAALCCMPLFLAAYSIVLLYFYLQMLSDYEALLNASSERYLATFFIGWIMAELALALRYGTEVLPQNAVRVLQAAAAVGLLSLQVNALARHNVLNWNYTKNQAGRVGFDGVCAQMAEHLKPDDKVWVIACDLDAAYIYMYHYLLYPADVYMLELPYSTSQQSFPRNDKEFDELLESRSIDYIVVYTTNAEMQERFKDRFSDELQYVAKNELPCLYRVEKDGGCSLQVETVDVSKTT